MTRPSDDYATPEQLRDVEFAMPTRMYAQQYVEIEAQETDDAAAVSAARRVIALLDAPAPPDPPDSATVTVRSVEALAAAYALLADAAEGLLFCIDRSGRHWAVGARAHSQSLMAWAHQVLPIPLRELVADHGPLELDGIYLRGIAFRPRLDQAAEAARGIMSILLQHGIRATAIGDQEGAVTVWNPLATITDEEWCLRVRAILSGYGIRTDLAEDGGAVEISRMGVPVADREPIR